MKPFSSTIINWYTENKRDLPWRNTTNPYPIWLSEIMLQQTRVAQGLPYFNKFIEAFPTVHDLAQASEDKVLKLWQGLGYYSRARNLHATAQEISVKNDGVFPTTYKELLRLKGVGRYTAAAIASFCYNQPVAVLDGNVYRVIARFMGIDIPTNTADGERIFSEKAALLLDQKNAAVYNQAIMEFGALQCTPKQPNCKDCPLQNQCVAFQQGKQETLPVKLKKTNVRTLHFNYIVFITPDHKLLLRKRTENSIWKHLHEFPLLETNKKATKKEIIEFSGDQKNLHQWNKKAITHLLSHRKILAHFWIAEVKIFPKKLLDNEYFSLHANELNNYAVPVLVEQFVNAYFGNEAM